MREPLIKEARFDKQTGRISAYMLVAMGDGRVELLKLTYSTDFQEIRNTLISVKISPVKQGIF